MLNIQIRPIITWPGKENENLKDSPFRSTYAQTLDLLESELDKAGVVWSSLALEMWGINEYDIRKDGALKATAKPDKPGVIFRFSRYTNGRYDKTAGKWIYDTQDISYPCDAFTWWQDNLRAIALSMESLRRVERYGVFKYDEIISRLALPSAEGKVSTRESAAAFLAQHSGVSMKEILFSDTARSAAYRRAAHALHPDKQGGVTDDFVKLTEANKVLTATA